LNKWNIDTINTAGEVTDKKINKIVDSNKEKKLVNPMDMIQGGNQDSEDRENGTIEDNQEITEQKLLDSSVKSFIEVYKYWIKTSVNIFNDVIINRDVDKNKVRNFILEIIQTVNKNRNNALMIFGKKFEGVPYLHPKTIETIILAYIIGDSLCLSQLAISNLGIATLFHDIGMLKIPKSILEKPAKLNENEIKVINSHTNIGYKLLREVKYSAIIASGALQHHERIDGKGYPNRLTPDKVTEIAKIIAVVDAYCAAIATKPFTTSHMHQKEVIQDLLRSGGTKYEPTILKELIKNISFYPIGSLVLLSSNKPARVVGTSGMAMKPIVRELSKEGPGTVIDLSKSNNIYIKDLYTKETPDNHQSS
jgi:HD-GYP domain-containing protein (c-di-GMP phosphodiesterase class II)